MDNAGLCDKPEENYIFPEMFRECSRFGKSGMLKSR